MATRTPAAAAPAAAGEGLTPYPADRLYRLLLDDRWDFYTGVPCSLLAPLYDVIDRERAEHYAATREDLALGIAAGAALAGRRPVVLMQNSGLGVAVNALASLTSMYRLPVLLLVTWRGYGADSPEHEHMGRRTPELLDLLDIPFAFASEVEEHVELLDQAGIAALLVRRGELR